MNLQPCTPGPCVEVPNKNVTSGTLASTPTLYSGLTNRKGENNCFLNAVVQCFLHVPSFVHGFTLLSHRCALTSCVACTFRTLMQNYVNDGQDIFLVSSEKEPSIETPVVNSSALREVVSAACAHLGLFQVEEMNDAMEACEELLKLLGKEDKAESSNSLESVFSSRIMTYGRCSKCDTKKREMQYDQIIQYVQAANLMQVGLTAELQQQQADVPHECDQENCKGGMVEYVRIVPSIGSALIIGVIWRLKVSKDDVAQFLNAIPQTLLSTDLQGKLSRWDRPYRLRGFVAFVAAHYVSFVRQGNTERWVLFDDSNVRERGDWDAVKKLIINGRLQPLILFYDSLDIAATSSPSGLSSLAGTPRSDRKGAMDLPPRLTDFLKLNPTLSGVLRGPSHSPPRAYGSEAGTPRKLMGTTFDPARFGITPEPSSPKTTYVTERFHTSISVKPSNDNGSSSVEVVTTCDGLLPATARSTQHAPVHSSPLSSPRQYAPNSFRHITLPRNRVAVPPPEQNLPSFPRVRDYFTSPGSRPLENTSFASESVSGRSHQFSSPRDSSYATGNSYSATHSVQSPSSFYSPRVSSFHSSAYRLDDPMTRSPRQNGLSSFNLQSSVYASQYTGLGNTSPRTHLPMPSSPSHTYDPMKSTYRASPIAVPSFTDGLYRNGQQTSGYSPSFSQRPSPSPLHSTTNYSTRRYYAAL